MFSPMEIQQGESNNTIFESEIVISYRQSMYAN